MKSRERGQDTPREEWKSTCGEIRGKTKGRRGGPDSEQGEKGAVLKLKEKWQDCIRAGSSSPRQRTGAGSNVDKVAWSEERRPAADTYEKKKKNEGWGNEISAPQEGMGKKRRAGGEKYGGRTSAGFH